MAAFILRTMADTWFRYQRANRGESAGGVVRHIVAL